MSIKILFIGDVFGEPGRQAVKTLVPKLREEHHLDLVIANCENAAQGRGVTVKMVSEFFKSSVDFLTSGNHIWHCHDIYPFLGEPNCKLLRPANLPREAPGRGAGIIETAKGLRVAVFNIMGRIFMNPPANCPFQSVDDLIGQFSDESDLMVLDFHAETTSEKKAMGWHLDGKLQACVGTHTHVATADEEILPKGCAYITDLGMTGPHDSVIGQNKESIIRRFRTSLPVKFEVGVGDVRLNGAIVDIDERTKKAVSIKRVCERLPCNS